MSFFSKIRGTFETIFQIGKNGPQVKNNSGVLEMRNATDTAFVITRGLDPVGAQDYVTKTYFDTNNSSAMGLTYIKMPLLLATKVSTVTIPDNVIIRDAILEITTAYDAGRTWSITRTGDGTKNPIAGGDNDAQAVGVYQVPQVLSWGSTGTGTVTATIAGGAPAAGVAILYIGYVTPTDIS